MIYMHERTNVAHLFDVVEKDSFCKLIRNKVYLAPVFVIGSNQDGKQICKQCLEEKNGSQ